ncbi:MAG: DUF1127 domain-containing protein [Nitratireductor sp.]|nr:DUF1127 domain-containing protein [Nitratireductor sp.]
MAIDRIDHFDLLTGRGQNLDNIRRERLPAMIYRLVVWLDGRFAKNRSRRALADLDPRLLADVGISSDERRSELARGFLD